MFNEAKMRCLVIEPSNEILLKEIDYDEIKSKVCFYFNGVCDAYIDDGNLIENKIATEICRNLDIIGSSGVIFGQMIVAGFIDTNENATDVPQVVITEIFNYIKPKIQNDNELLICCHSSVLSGLCESCGIDIKGNK